ncbi:hypothetical protein NW761_010943 [Fusarium oxysporum]|nr:hypothetical protein NW758_009955 [Fusarium oxysporum]KAJ4070467.1 hypothetical protein NW753_001340 [Fusarium oxysporum]KAJ4071776.1 hypothetical protein NW763_000799 [Fusarium oxysporum]KAJ4073222.1 hypothetical protein NW756_014307 [Fusarium oxysporum]KAJ4080430.1 hypothetical protein NW761_010943 [Fusarium oxysporum]
MPSWETHRLARVPCLHLPYQLASTARSCKASNRHAKIKILAPAHPPLTPAFKATASSSPFLLFHINISLEKFSFQHLKHPLSNNSIEFISQPPAPRPVSLRLTLTRDRSPSFVP